VYIIDQCGKEAGHIITSLPANFNPSKMVYGKLKGYMARHKIFKHQKVCQQVEAKLGEITSDRQQDAIHHIIWEEQKLWELDSLTHNTLVINTKDDKTSSNLFNSDS
jgi:hypothetical protein